jgi:hypothetical protein
MTDKLLYLYRFRRRLGDILDNVLTQDLFKNYYKNPLLS